MITTAVILAAGRGSRLKEVTTTRSKALVPIAGVPMIGRVIESLQGAGISKLIVVRAPHDDELQKYCSTLHSTTVVVQPEPRGSGDALRLCEGHVPEGFLVCACDSLVSSLHIRAVVDAHCAAGVAATLSVMEVASEVSLESRSVVQMQGDKVLDIIEKPTSSERISNITALPLYALSQKIFKELATLSPSARGEYELPAAFRGMIRRGDDVRAVKAIERHDLTDQRDLLLLNRLFLARLSPMVQIHPSVQVPASAKIAPPLLVEEGVTIGDGVELGPFVYIERGARVADGCSVVESVVLRGVTVTESCSGVVVTQR